MLASIEEAIQYVESGEIQKGLDLLNSIKNNAKHDDKFTIAECYLNWGLLDEAKEIVDELLLLYPDEGQLYVLAAEILIDLENEEEAIELLNEIKITDPSYIQSLVLLADLYQMQGLDEVAEQKLLEAKRKKPNESLIDFGLGEFYLSKGEYKKSISYYNKVIETEEKIGDRNIHLCLAEALTLTGMFEEALEHYEKGLKDKVEIHALFGYGFTAYKLERYELAIAKWEELKKLDPEYTSIYFHLAQAYEQEEAIEEAYNTTKQGLAVDEYNKELLFYSGKLGLKNHKKEEAESYLREAIALDPGYLEATLTLTKFLLHEERYDDVVECINYALDFNEYDPNFDWDLAIAKKELELYSDALKHYENAYNAFKENIDFLEEFGLFLLEEGKREQAKKLFEQILKIDASQSHIQEELIRLEEW